jgi:hypothetical protein
MQAGEVDVPQTLGIIEVCFRGHVVTSSIHCSFTRLLSVGRRLGSGQQVCSQSHQLLGGRRIARTRSRGNDRVAQLAQSVDAEGRPLRSARLGGELRIETGATVLDECLFGSAECSVVDSELP